jgi:hypothetical protein
MVSNTEVSTNSNVSVSNQFMQMSSSNSSSGAGAIGRLRQTLQQAHESVSTRLQNRTGASQQPSDLQGVDTSTENIPNVNISLPPEEKENQEAA